MGDADCSSDKAKASRLSCTECQRRKQKCSREWPCNHCRSRKVAHLCRFGSKKADSPKEESVATSTVQKRRRRTSDVDEDTKTYDPFRDHFEATDDEEAGLEAWGYMPGHKHFGLDNGVLDNTKDAYNKRIVRSDEIRNALAAIPPRFLTDSLIENYIRNANYHFYATYPPTLLDDYANWWTDRAKGKEVTPVLTCLLLRILAMSAQYLNSAELRSKVEFELSESAQALTERFHNAAEKLSATMKPGKGGLQGVQQLFLKAVWYKSEGLFVQSWHALGEAIREAQEIGMHKDDIPENVDDFEIEMRRRLWCLLYVFDWQMAAWLHRPLIIDPSNCSFTLPNLRLEDSLNSEQGAPSPFAHMALQTKLCQILSGALANKPQDEPPEKWHYRWIKIVGDFINSFPEAYRVDNPDTRWDRKYSYVSFQRHYLHTCSYMIQLDPLKPYLTAPLSVSNPAAHDLQAIAVDLILKVMAAVGPWWATIYPISARFHFVIFAIFDTGSVLCSSILHDTNRTLPRRNEVVEAIGDALAMLSKLALNTKAGRISYAFVDKLACKLPLSPAEKALLQPSKKRQRTTFRDFPTPASQTRSSDSTSVSTTSLPLSSATSTSAEAMPPHSAPPTLSNPIPAYHPEYAVPVPIAPASVPDWPFDPVPGHANFQAVPGTVYPAETEYGVPRFDAAPLSGMPPPLDFGGLDQIWDWQSLNVDTGLDPIASGVVFDPPAGGPNPNANLNINVNLRLDWRG